MYLPVIMGNTIFVSGMMKTQFLKNLILLFSYSFIHSVSFKAGSLKMNTALEYSTTVREWSRRGAVDVKKVLTI